MTTDAPSNTPVSADHCHICNGLDVTIIPGYEMFCRVTSDCKPWPKGGRLLICKTCGCLQKAIDQVWQSEIEGIYNAYSIYHQSSGVEQSVFNQVSGSSASRSARLLEHLGTHLKLAKTGRLLDIGCGNGALLRAFNNIAPEWRLVGTELNEKYRDEIENIRGVESLQACSPESVPGEFDIITMIHVLEHIPEPAVFLEKLSAKLKPDGILMIEVPDYLRNPFDLLIADHSTHFTSETLAGVIFKAGYEVVLATRDWVSKELTLLAKKTDRVRLDSIATHAAGQSQAVVCIDWLNQVVASARQLSAANLFGIFGTSIAATWLYGELSGLPAFFLDEDLSRVGRDYMRLPVYHPKDAPPGSHVFIPVPANHGQTLKARLEGMMPNCNFSLAAALSP